MICSQLYKLIFLWKTQLITITTNWWDSAVITKMGKIVVRYNNKIKSDDNKNRIYYPVHSLSPGRVLFGLRTNTLVRLDNEETS